MTNVEGMMNVEAPAPTRLVRAARGIEARRWTNPSLDRDEPGRGGLGKRAALVQNPPSTGTSPAGRTREAGRVSAESPVHRDKPGGAA